MVGKIASFGCKDGEESSTGAQVETPTGSRGGGTRRGYDGAGERGGYLEIFENLRYGHLISQRYLGPPFSHEHENGTRTWRVIFGGGRRNVRRWGIRTKTGSQTRSCHSIF